MGIKELLVKVGDNHNYQYCVLALLCLKVILVSHLFVGPSYLFINPIFMCNTDEQQTLFQEIEACPYIDSCTIVQSNSITAQLQLYCSKRWLRNLIQSMQFAGNVLGMLIMNFCSDWRGRRWSYLLSMKFCLIGLISTIIGSLTNMALLIIMGQFVIGLGAGSCYVISFVIISDLFSDSLRQTGILAVNMSWGIGQMLYFLVDKLLSRWQSYLIGCIAIPCAILFIVARWLLVESPEYLSRHSRQDCWVALNRIAQWNGREPISFEDIPVGKEQQQQSQQPKLDLSQILKRENLFRMIILGCLKTSMAINYYGVQFAMDSHTLSFGTNMLILGMVEFVGYGTLNLVIRKLKRKPALIYGGLTVALVSMLLGGVSSPTGQFLSMALNRFLITYIYGVVILFVNEVFPNAIKSSTSGVVEAFHNVGSMSAPYLVSWSHDMGVRPIILCSMILLGGSMGVCLIEQPTQAGQLDENGDGHYEEMREVKEKN